LDKSHVNTFFHGQTWLDHMQMFDIYMTLHYRIVTLQYVNRHAWAIVCNCFFHKAEIIPIVFFSPHSCLYKESGLGKCCSVHRELSYRMSVENE